MPDRDTIALAIRSTREKQSITQQQLAEQAGIGSLQTISDIERGVREVKAWELVRVARALSIPVDVLLGLQPAVSMRVFWRRGTAQQSRRAESLFLERARRFALLELWCELPPVEPLPEWALDPRTASFADASRLAEQAGQVLNLGSRPAASLLPTLEERFRVKVFYDDLGDDESAATVRGDFGPAILMNAREAPWRRNYNFAHELFHLVTWSAVDAHLPADGSEPDWLEKLEQLANAFASRLLLPADAVESEFVARVREGRIGNLELVELARQFDVSTAALLWRVVNMGRLRKETAESLLTNDNFKRADRQSMSDRWWAPPGPLPDRFKRLATLAYRKGKVSKARLAEFLEVSLSEVPDIDLEDESVAEASVPAA